MNSLYRFYNWKVERHGVPFALCEKHAKTQIVPDTCYLEKIADTTEWSCEDCEQVEAMKP